MNIKKCIITTTYKYIQYPDNNLWLKLVVTYNTF